MTRDDPVMVCELCGCGFLVNPGSKIHPTPAWFTSFSQADGACLGNIRMAYRSTLIRNLDNWEILDVRSRSGDQDPTEGSQTDSEASQRD